MWDDDWNDVDNGAGTLLNVVAGMAATIFAIIVILVASAYFGEMQPVVYGDVVEFVDRYPSVHEGRRQ